MLDARLPELQSKPSVLQVFVLNKFSLMREDHFKNFTVSASGQPSKWFFLRRVIELPVGTDLRRGITLSRNEMFLFYVKYENHRPIFQTVDLRREGLVGYFLCSDCVIIGGCSTNDHTMLITGALSLGQHPIICYHHLHTPVNTWHKSPHHFQLTFF